MARSPIVIDVSKLVEKISPKPGDVVGVRLPEGLSTQEMEEMARMASDAIAPTGAIVIILSRDTSFQMIEDGEMAWLADQGLALRGYRAPDGSLRFKVVHPHRGVLSDAPSHLEALRLARGFLQRKKKG